LIAPVEKERIGRNHEPVRSQFDQAGKNGNQTIG